jgi:hypothetical protein
MGGTLGMSNFKILSMRCIKLPYWTTEAKNFNFLAFEGEAVGHKFRLLGSKPTYGFPLVLDAKLALLFPMKHSFQIYKANIHVPKKVIKGNNRARNQNSLRLAK